MENILQFLLLWFADMHYADYFLGPKWSIFNTHPNISHNTWLSRSILVDAFGGRERGTYFGSCLQTPWPCNNEEETVSQCTAPSFVGISSRIVAYSLHSVRTKVCIHQVLLRTSFLLFTGANGVQILPNYLQILTAIFSNVQTRSFGIGRGWVVSLV